MAQRPFIFGLAGFSGSGKTTLAEKLISTATEKGVRIATIKHAHHRFEADIEGKDSWRHRKAGAQQTLIASAHRSALFTENTVEKRPELSDLLARLNECDWVLVEGFKFEAITKIEIYDEALGHTPLYQTDDNITALVSDKQLDDCDLPQFNRNDVDGIFQHLHSLAKRDKP